MDDRPDTPEPRSAEEPTGRESDAAPGGEPEEEAPFLGKLLLVLFPFLLLLALYLVDRLLLPDR